MAKHRTKTEIEDLVHDNLSSYLKYIQNENNNKINLSDYFLKNNINFNYISNSYRKHTGFKVKQTYMNLKISKCKELLLQGKSLIEISKILDYSSNCHLANHFKKETGQTTTEFLKTNNK